MKVFVLGARLIFAVLTGAEATIGIWAELWPRSFFVGFPGGGWRWLSALGPYDEHLTRDFGGLSMALAAVTLVAALTPTRAAAATACAAWEVYSVPHLIFHLLHLDALPAIQNVVNITSLSACVAAPAAAAALVWTSGGGGWRSADRSEVGRPLPSS